MADFEILVQGIAMDYSD